MAAALLIAPASLRSQTPDTQLATILEKMRTEQRQREQQLLAFESSQTLQAIMGSDVRAVLGGVLSYQAPDQMQFRQTRASGSSFLRSRVLLPIIDHELASVGKEQRRKHALTRDNYDFRLVSDESNGVCRCYVLELKPRRKSEDLIRGRIWVDAQDYAVRHLEGYLAGRPSFWVRSARVVRDYQKIGAFWLPTLTHSENQVLLFGRTDVDLHTNYARVHTWQPTLAKAETAPPERYRVHPIARVGTQ